jgi:hypothetical protein
VALAAEMSYSLRTTASDVASDPSASPARVDEEWRALKRRLDEFRAAFAEHNNNNNSSSSSSSLEASIGSSAAGDEFAIAGASAAIALGDPVGALEIMKAHTFAHEAHGPRPRLTDIWLAAQVAIEEAKLGHPLTSIERSIVKYDKGRAPPLAMGAIDRPQFEPRVNVSWP